MLVIDTSVLLNLLGSCRPQFLLNHIPFEVIVPQAVFREITREPNMEAKTDADLSRLIERGSLRVVEPDREVEEIALSLTGAPSPDDLDDGEAFAIAQAVVMNARLTIDERKGRRIVERQFPQIVCLFTLDLIEQAALRASLGEAELAQLIYSALFWTRMRIPNERRDSIISLIGKERARKCPSLGYVFL
jgi:predicted nucleic acid-binding protein